MACACGVQEISLESENPLTRHFDRLADGLWLFLDIHDRVRRLGDEEQAKWPETDGLEKIMQ